jgi:SAM-dependent methyltransferase
MDGARRYNDVRYLHAKRSVDDRALNRPVLEQLRGLLATLPPPVRVLELGAGVGTMVSRLADLGWIGRGRYTLVDRDGASLAAAAEHLRRWGGAAARGDGARIVVRDGTRDIDLEVDLVEADVFDWLAAAVIAERRYDLVVANAFLDLVDVGALLPALWRCVSPGRPFWFSVNFDGETIFLPERPLDGAVMALYNRCMDERVRDGRRAGESKTGRHLLQRLPQSGARLLGAGSSDWIVFPSDAASDVASDIASDVASDWGPGDTAVAGRYPEDEAYFLHYIVHTIDVALSGAASLGAGAFADWIDERHRQIDRGELIYIAHQIDVVGRAPG